MNCKDVHHTGYDQHDEKRQMKYMPETEKFFVNSECRDLALGTHVFIDVRTHFSKQPGRPRTLLEASILSIPSVRAAQALEIHPIRD